MVNDEADRAEQGRPLLKSITPQGLGEQQLCFTSPAELKQIPQGIKLTWESAPSGWSQS